MALPIGPVIAHRGASGHAPENTHAALRMAAALGVPWVEFDVRLSGDGRPVLLHDDDLERTTDGRGPVSNYPVEQLRMLDAGGWFGRAFRGERIPTLEGAIGTLMLLGLGANVEIKTDPGREAETGEVVAHVLKKAWPRMLPPPVLSSFKAEVLAAARRAASDYPLALVVREIPRDWRERLDTLDCSALHCSHRWLKRKTVDSILAAGVTVRCYTVNSRRSARKLFAWGVEAVFSDYPDRLAGTHKGGG